MAIWQIWSTSINGCSGQVLARTERGDIRLSNSQSEGFLSTEKGNTIVTENYGHHTAIVYNVMTKDHIELAHQNTSFSGKKVVVSTLRLNNVQKGKMIFYHPIKN